MKKNIFFLLTQLVFLSSFSQTWQWAKREGSWYTEGCKNAVTDNAGNTFVILTNYEDITINGVLNTWCGSPGSILIKYSPTGDVLWTRKLCVYDAVGMTLDNNGNCVVSVVGYQGHTLQNGSGGYDTLTNGSWQTAFVKYASNGDLMWYKYYDPTLRQEEAYQLVSDGQNNIYALVNIDSTYSSQYYLTKLNSSGIVIWQLPTNRFQYGDFNCLAVDSESNVYIQGSTEAAISFAGHTIDPSGINETFIIKLDSTGTFLWMKEYPGWADGTSMKISPSGKIILSGKSYYTPTTFGTALVNANDFFIAEFDADGNELWVKSNSSTFGRLALYNETIYFGGYFYDTLIFNEDSMMLFSPHRLSSYVMELNSSGDIMWTKVNATGISGYSMLSYINVDLTGNIIAAGIFRDSLAFDAITLFCGDDPDRTDLFVAKLSPPGLTGIENPGKINCTVFPNPSSGIFTLSLSSPKPSVIKVYDLMGNCLLTKHGLSNNILKVDLSDQAKGIYFLEVSAEEGKMLKKIILQ